VKEGAVIVKESVVETVKLPEVPVMVRVAGPGVAVLLALSVSKLVPVIGFVPQDAVTPLGKPETDSVALPEKPYCGVSVIVELPDPPGFMLRLLGEAERRNVGA